MPAGSPTSSLWRAPSPAGSTILTWVVSIAYTSLVSLRLPGSQSMFADGSVVRWLMLGGATVVTVAGAVLLARWPVPAAVLLLTGGVCGAAAAGGAADPPVAQFLALDVALGQIAANHSRRIAVAGGLTTVVLYAGYQGVRLATGWGAAVTEALLVVSAAAVAWLIGRSVRERREHAAALRARDTADAINAERLRISRELHDMVAHNIATVALQAGSANLVIDTQPAVVRQALLAIESASRETLAGLRRMLVTLREADEEAAPLPGLGDVPRLVAEHREAGLDVDLRCRGENRTLPPAVDVAAYRIIQEAITNVVRHAGTRSCRVSLDYRDAELLIDVTDEGNSAGADPGAGYGLIGMRERVSLLNGDLSAGPRPQGGFRVTARLPTPATVR